MTMPVGKNLARKTVLTINTGTFATPVWTAIKGMTKLAPGSDKSDTETTDFDSDGWAEHMVAERGRSLDIEGYYLEDPTGGARDPGQVALLAKADLMGPDSIGHFKLTSPGGNTLFMYASVKADNTGGGNNDNNGFSAELTVSKKPSATMIAY